VPNAIESIVAGIFRGAKATGLANGTMYLLAHARTRIARDRNRARARARSDFSTAIDAYDARAGMDSRYSLRRTFSSSSAKLRLN